MITNAQALEMSKLAPAELETRLEFLLAYEKAKEAAEVKDRGEDAVVEYLVNRLSEEELIRIFLVWASEAV